MGKVYSPEMIPDVGVSLPGGRFLFTIAEMDDSEATSKGNYQIVAQLSVVEPSSLAGNPHREYFVIGNPDDPNADDPDTWKGYAAGRYKQMLKKAGVEMTGDVEQDIAAATGQQVGGQVSQEIEPPLDKDGNPNQYAGRIRSRVVGFFRPGERETGLDPAAGSGLKSAVPAKPAAPVKAASAPPPPKNTIKPPVAAPKPAAPKAAAPKAVPMLPCPMCNEKVPRDQFGAHVAGHDGETAEEE